MHIGRSHSSTSTDGRDTIIVSSSTQNVENDEKIQRLHFKENQAPIDEKDSSTSYFSATSSTRTHPLAWIGLFFLVVLRSSVSIFQNTFSPIPNIVADYLNVSLTEVNWLFNIQAVVYIVLSFITGWMFERLGTKRSVSILAKAKK
ncbi:hypothetical protein BDB00DRAFT_213423 [Zychaea mexicana]|uniref:uncharacterized protein n=1 Tax=Zychaea mexicana TaxID=64656 RepID=UPI0022FDD277|nr:uncharacterized protein BDB00DRAFT_213423 [Zychaea mexicana]KAI9495729.1 hypothetical protein BDB00DRAFT_213423 [Zychaea mexicana]